MALQAYLYFETIAVIGRTVDVCVEMPATKSHLMSRILDLMRKVKAPHHHLRLNSEFRKDLHWWRHFLPLYSGVSLILPS